MSFKEILKRFKLISLTTWSIFAYYNALYPNYQVMGDYIGSGEYGYCSVTALAILFSLLAQTFYCKKLSIYENTPYCIAAFVSILYCTPLVLLVSFIKWQCQKGVDNTIKYQQYVNGDMQRIGLITNFFEAPVLVCIQIYIIGQFILYSDDTRQTNHITYPSNNIAFLWLLYAAITSFKRLSDAAWTRISDMIKGVDGTVEQRSKLCRTILFRIRAFAETLIRALRFMMVSSIYGGLIGFLLLFIEVLWKWSLLSCCCCVTDKIRGNKDKLAIGFKIYAVATWMVFSHERFQNWPYFMRILDIFLWTFICVILSIVGVFYHYSMPSFVHHSFMAKILNKVEINGICNGFGMFRKDCYPIEILLSIAFLLILLAVVYKLSPSIFVLLEATKQQKMMRQPLVSPSDHGYIEMHQMNVYSREYLQGLSKSQVIDVALQLQQKIGNTPRASQMIQPVIPLPQIQGNYIQQQSQMIQTMNQPPMNTIIQQQALSQAQWMQYQQQQQQQRAIVQQRRPSFLEQQGQMIQTMNQPNYIQSQMLMIDTMNQPFQQQQQQPQQQQQLQTRHSFLESQQQMLQTMNQP
eukprot:24905_1